MRRPAVAENRRIGASCGALFMELAGIINGAQPGLAVPLEFFSNVLDLTPGLATASNALFFVHE